ncbi:50S ribosomal protein L18 [Gemella sp. GH3]|uniref:50S ribosomal protein L18 n=1 Tax=unclassified Gemella TaxID=2624949 RepID=UPI0015CFCE1E|nr:MULTISPECIES: 50S ribosomal protein L18 [unclassified Gemella]MBF0713138.1 50S ribosomal protein L18 [Gemella sp. GH3.1]NYS50090.1 50S ribosomal protein L18 [Gemella sp. GH3]
MITKLDKNKVRKKRHARVRVKVEGTSEVPRLNVFRSNKYIYAQIIDDSKSITLAEASSLKLSEVSKSSVAAASEVGKLIAEAAKEKGITKVVFDRGGYLYHGRVQALAEAARENGLVF